MAVDNVGMDVPIKFGDSRSNDFRDIRGADFVSNERTNIGEPYPNNAKPKAFRLKSHASVDLCRLTIYQKLYLDFGF